MPPIRHAETSFLLVHVNVHPNHGQCQHLEAQCFIIRKCAIVHSHGVYSWPALSVSVQRTLCLALSLQSTKRCLQVCVVVSQRRGVNPSVKRSTFAVIVSVRDLGNAKSVSILTATDVFPRIRFISYVKWTTSGSILIRVNA